ncbi:MAG: phosphatase PAP2 family protein [Anaerolineae bacterium]
MAQSHNSAIIDTVFRLITFLGDKEFVLILVPLVFWCIDKRTGIRLAVLLLLSVYLNTALKDALGWPRPPAGQVRQVVAEEGFGMPSGHAQNNIIIWGYLASTGGRIGWGIAGLIALVVGMSRVFIGVHYPQDVVGGWIVGIVMLAVSLLALQWLDSAEVSPAMTWAAALLAPVTFASAHPVPDTARAMGALLGLAIGYLLERQLVHFNPQTSWARQIAKVIVGGTVLAALWIGLKTVMPDANAFHFLRYGIVGLWGTFLAPWMFVKAGWAGKREL